MTDPGSRNSSDAGLQAAYELGWHQEYEHDSLRTRDWIEVEVRDADDDAQRCELRAAMLTGAADALLALAYGQREGAAFARAWRDGER